MDVFHVGRHQIDAWISRGYLAPQTDCEGDKARIFTMTNPFALGAIVNFGRIGFEPARVAPNLTNLHDVADGEPLLVIYEGPIRLSSQEGEAFMGTNIPAAASQIIPPHNLANLMTDPDIRAFAVVNLNDIERRVIKASAPDLFDPTV